MFCGAGLGFCTLPELGMHWECTLGILGWLSIEGRGGVTSLDSGDRLGTSQGLLLGVFSNLLSDSVVQQPPGRARWSLL